MPDVQNTLNSLEPQLETTPGWKGQPGAQGNTQPSQWATGQLVAQHPAAAAAVVADEANSGTASHHRSHLRIDTSAIVYTDQMAHQTSDIRLLWTAITQTINPPPPPLL